MCNILEALGKGLQTSLMETLLPRCGVLGFAEEEQLIGLIQKSPNDLAYKLRLGVHLALIGSSESAEKTFQEIIKLDPHHLDTHLAWAAMYSSDGQLKKAMELLKKALQYHGSNSRLLFALGYCCERQNKTPKAIEYYEQAKQGKPFMLAPLYRLGAIHIKENKIDKAIEQYKTLQKDRPEEVWNYLILGQLYMHQEKFSEASDIFERALTIEPDNFEMHDDYIEQLIESEDYYQAIDEIKKIMQKQGEFADTFVRMADIYTHLNDDASAVENYEKAIELHPNYLEAVVKLGTQHLRMGRFYEAASQLNLGVQINDQLIMTYTGLALAQFGNDQPDLGSDTLDLAQALEPNTNLLFAEVARLQLKIAMTKNFEFEECDTLALDKIDDQERDKLLATQIERHRESLMENPNNADLHYRYGLLQRGKNRIDEAIRHFQSSLDINPTYYKPKLKLALALRENREHAKAIEHLKESFSLKSDYINLHYKLGLMYCDRIQFELVLEHFKFDKTDFKMSNLQDNVSLALQNMGLVDRVAATWQAVCELDPESSMAYASQRSVTQLKYVQ